MCECVIERVTLEKEWVDERMALYSRRRFHHELYPQCDGCIVCKRSPLRNQRNQSGAQLWWHSRGVSGGKSSKNIFFYLVGSAESFFVFQKKASFLNVAPLLGNCCEGGRGIQSRKSLCFFRWNERDEPSLSICLRSCTCWLWDWRQIIIWAANDTLAKYHAHAFSKTFTQPSKSNGPSHINDRIC